jgi:hypothetical protein
MEDASKYLLSSRRMTDNYYIIRETGKELERYTTEHMMISKYHERYWFQKLRHQSKEQLLERYFYLCGLIETCESLIKQAQEEIGMHLAAEEDLHQSMTPNLGGLYLSQQSLF